VDGVNQIEDGGPATLQLFGVGPGIEIAQASAKVYEQCDRYQRTCVLIQTPGDQTYAVDLFRVRGGKLHQYGFHSNGSLTELSTEVSPDDQKFEWLSNIRSGGPVDTIKATWQNEEVKIDLTLLNATDRLLLADAPGWRSDVGSELNRPPVQQILAERVSDGEASSQFASIISPYTDTSPIRSSRILVDDHESGAIGLEVIREGATDYILSNPAGNTLSVGPVTTDGRFAFVSLSLENQVARAYLLDGTSLSVGKKTLSPSEGRTELMVASATDRTYVIAGEIPGQTGPGQYLLADGTGYEIESVSGQIITVRDYPAIPCETVTILNSASLLET
jgi:hypothetical protein